MRPSRPVRVDPAPRPVRLAFRCTWPAISGLVGLMCFALGYLAALPDARPPLRGVVCRPAWSAAPRVAAPEPALLTATTATSTAASQAELAPADPDPPAPPVPSPGAAPVEVAATAPEGAPQPLLPPASPGPWLLDVRWPVLDPRDVVVPEGQEPRPYLARLLLELVRSLQGQNQPAAAGPYLEAALGLWPEPEVIDACFYAQPVRTREWLEQAHARAPRNLAVTRGLLYAHGLASRYGQEEARSPQLLQLVLEVLALDPADEWALLQLQELAPAEAVERERVLPLERRSEDRLYSAMIQSGRQAELLSLVQARLEDGSAPDYRALGWECHLDPDRGLARVQALRRASPEDWELLELQLDGLRRQERWAELLAALRVASDRAGHHSQLAIWLAEHLEWLEQDQPGVGRSARELFGELLDRLERAGQLAPGGELWLHLREVDPERWIACILQGRDPQALDALPYVLCGLPPERLAEWLPRLPACAALWSELAEQLESDDRPQEALLVVQRACGLLPEDWTLRERLRRLTIPREE